MPEEEAPRIGVFVCHCGTNIGGYVDVPAVVEYAKTLPDVVHAEHNLYTCAEDGLTSIRDKIKEHKLNRVIVASCTPRTHAPLFQATCESAGLNKYLFTFVNIREQCSWVHRTMKDLATQKAKDLIRMGVARARKLTPQNEQKIPVKQVALVIGGGVAGMSTALSLANQGFPVHLVEKTAELGGIVRNLSNLWMESGDPMTSIDPTIKQVKEHTKIALYLNSEVEKVDGYIGNFKIDLRSGDKVTKVEAGVIIVAIGAQEYIPEGFYGYDQFDNVITLAELEILAKNKAIPDVKDVAFIQCVGARGQDLTYCSRVCCNVALKNAIYLKDHLEASKAAGTSIEAVPTSLKIEAKGEVGDELVRRRRSRRQKETQTAGEEIAPEAPAALGQKVNITIFNRTINAYGVHHEIYYNKAREKRIKFVKFDLEHLPEVSREGHKLKIKYYQHSLGEWRDMLVDLVVLSTPLEAIPDTERISKLLKVPRGQDGFFLEAHVKLRPVEFATEGIYLAGTCRAPADIMEAVHQANAAASRAAIPLTKGYVQVEALTSSVDTLLCVGCGTCESVCSFGAITVRSTDQGKKAEVNLAACKGCGACASVCPQLAITMTHYTDEQILSEALAIVKEEVKQ